MVVARGGGARVREPAVCRVQSEMRRNPRKEGSRTFLQDCRTRYPTYSYTVTQGDNDWVTRDVRGPGSLPAQRHTSVGRCSGSGSEAEAARLTNTGISW